MMCYENDNLQFHFLHIQYCRARFEEEDIFMINYLDVFCAAICSLFFIIIHIIM